MNIALFGYGRMGKAIETIALERHHSIVAKIDENTSKDIDLSKVDVAIDFSIPEAAFSNISFALEHGIPIVCGTTGWLHQYDQVIELCKEKKGSFLYASNFSLGVNLFFQLNKYLAKLVQPYDYQVSIKETHHVHKVDKPSGTAITLAEQILPNTEYSSWALKQKNFATDGLPIKSKRKGEIPGTHQIKYTSAIDTISIKHKAHNRNGFALGAVMAAEYIADKSGIFTMEDVLGLKTLNKSEK